MAAKIYTACTMYRKVLADDIHNAHRLESSTGRIS